jgi:CBS domain-containing protein
MMKAEQIMTKEVVTIQGSATVADAVKLMKDKQLRALIVEPRSATDPYGMVTETDIVYKVVAKFIEDKIEVAREEARAICAAKGATSPECAAAWDVLEELQAEAAHQRSKKKVKSSL